MGEASALLSALTWAVAIVLFRQSEQVNAQGINLFKNVVGLLLLAITVPAAGIAIDVGRSQEDWARLIASGLLGVALSGTLGLVALRRLGGALMATVNTAYAPVFVLLSILILKEELGVGLAIGGILVVGGVLYATMERTPDLSTFDRKSLRIGVIAGLCSIVAMALGVIVVKPVLERGALLEVTLIRLAAGVTGQLIWMLVIKSGRSALEAFRPSPTWRTLIPGSILGSYVAMLFWLGGFKWAPASIASVLNQMSVVFIIILSRIILKERVSVRRASGAAVALIGACLVVAL